MADIYEQHKAAFANVSAYVVMNAHGEPVATVAIKFPRDGAGRLYAYTHFYGAPMTRGWASGYGYDKRSPAVRDGFAQTKTDPYSSTDKPDTRWLEHCAQVDINAKAFAAHLEKADSLGWERCLENAGFKVRQAV